MDEEKVTLPRMLWTRDQLYRMYPPIDWKRLSVALLICFSLLGVAAVVL